MIRCTRTEPRQMNALPTIDLTVKAIFCKDKLTNNNTRN